MTPNEYIEKYHIPRNALSPEFNQQAFLDEFSQDFYQKVEGLTDYLDFKREVHKASFDFAYIRGVRPNKRGKLRDPLWKAFFAIYIVPKRREMFPEVQERVDYLRMRQQNGRVKEGD